MSRHMKMPISSKKSDVVDEMRRTVAAWRNVHGLTDEQVVVYLVMISAGYAERAYVTLPHQDPPMTKD